MRLAIVLAASLSGCVATSTSSARWTNKHPDWNPPQGLEYAIAKCDAEAEATTGYDWADNVLKKGKARVACMKGFGYE